MFEDIHQVDLPSISSVYPMSQLADRPDVNFPLKTDTSRLLVLVQSRMWAIFFFFFFFGRGSQKQKK